MINRSILPNIKTLFEKWPVITVTGPRQSGKTTLCRSAFADLDYVSLEDPDQRAYATEDPRGFLAEHSQGGVIFDEIQRAPELPSYLQRLVDERNTPGQFILTGSQQFGVVANISQSLAGRTAILKLLPFDFSEVGQYLDLGMPDRLIYRGFYPRIYEQGLGPTETYAAYFETYVERDLRQLAAIRDLSLFQKFVRSCAARVGGLLNRSDLASDTGVSHTTIREWLSLLEASYIIYLHRPWFTNTTKRLIKAEKVYFYDVGFAAYLIGIQNETHVKSHPLRGNLFENMIVIEALKRRYNSGLTNNLFFYRDANHVEVDLLAENGNALTLAEIKSAATVNRDFVQGIERFKRAFPSYDVQGGVIFSGANQQRSDYPFFHYSDLGRLI